MVAHGATALATGQGMTKSCKHGGAWVIASTFLWCPVCGAIRRMGLDVDGVTLTPRWRHWIQAGDRARALRQHDRVTR